MGRNMYIGVDDTAKRVKKIYIGVGGTAKKVLKGYVGVGGQAKLFFSSECENHSWVYPTDGTIHGTCQECDFTCKSTQVTASYDEQTATTHRRIDICELCGGAAIHEAILHSWQHPENELGHGICKECEYECTSTQLTSSYIEKTSTSHRLQSICDTCSGRVVDAWYSHGFEDGKCVECGYECTDHEWTKDGKCAVCGLTCTHTWIQGICNVCGYTCKHDETSTDTSEPDCTNDGSYTVTCDTCGLTVEGGSIPATGHPEDCVSSVSSYPGEPDCTTRGDVVYSCSACGGEWTVEGEAEPQLDHNYVDGICSMCGRDVNDQ